jgi:hypothetical protein
MALMPATRTGLTSLGCVLVVVGSLFASDREPIIQTVDLFVRRRRQPFGSRGGTYLGASPGRVRTVTAGKLF